MASTSKIRKRESRTWAPETSPPSGNHVNLRADGVCSRAYHDRSVFGQYARHLQGGHAGGLNACSIQHGLVAISQPPDNSLVHALPDACFHPFAGEGGRAALTSHVTPQPNSRGRYSHSIPVLSANRIQVKVARSSIRGRPPFNKLRAAMSEQRPLRRIAWAIASIC